jgi:hypothetical protein
MILAQFPNIYKMEAITMKITLDLETNEITAPKNFFETFAKQNEMIAKLGGEPIKPLDVVRKSFEIAMSDTDKYFKTRK